MSRSASVKLLNEQIQRAKDVVLEHGIAFERHCFNVGVLNGITKTHKTESYIQGTICELVSGNYAGFSRIYARDLKQGNADAYELLCVSTIINVVTVYPRRDMMECDLPETLHLDFLRLKSLRNLFHLHVLSAVVMEGVKDCIITCNLAVPGQQPPYCLALIEAATAGAVKDIYYGKVSFNSRSDVISAVSSTLKESMYPDHYKLVDGVLNEISSSDHCKYKAMVSQLDFSIQILCVCDNDLSVISMRANVFVDSRTIRFWH